LLKVIVRFMVARINVFILPCKQRQIRLTIGIFMADSSPSFTTLLEGELKRPNLRLYARKLTRNDADAADLVQEIAARALAKQDKWQPGTDLPAWLFTMLHHQFVSSVKENARGNFVDIDSVTALRSAAMVVTGNQTARLELRDLRRALNGLPKKQREAVLLIGSEGLDYETAARVVGVPVGAIRSRLSRGRKNLRQWMDGEKIPVAMPDKTAPVPVRAKRRGREGRGRGIAPELEEAIVGALRKNPRPSQVWQETFKDIVSEMTVHNVAKRNRDLVHGGGNGAALKVA
jgi:RNA polymerase sigma-70 factor (ECF subfamily)